MNAEAVRAWLSARYDADERVANACRYKSWTQDGGSIFSGHPTDEIVDWVYDEGGWEHIALHDPARALIEVAAKRRRLERHAPCDAGTAGHSWCEWCTSNDEYEGWPCPDVIDDAQTFADRPDFPAELRLP